MQPEALAASLVAANHASVARQSELVLHDLDRAQHRLTISAPEPSAKHFLPEARREAQSPRPFAELERDAENVAQYGRIKTAGRCCH
jgi:hypothetical protein